MYADDDSPTPLLISADSHFLDPPDLWERWLPSKHRAAAPQLVDDSEGGQAWFYAGAKKPEPIALLGVPGQPPDRIRSVGMRYSDVRPGTYDGTARAADQDLDGVAAEVIFPSSRPLSHFLDDPDEDFTRAGVEAYNQFVAEEFCAGSPDRLFPIAQLPTTGVDDCMSVLRWAAERDFVGAVLPCWPTGRDQLSAEDGKFWRCAEEIGLPICIHVSLRSREDRVYWREIQVSNLHRGETEMATVSHQAPENGMGPRPLEYHHRLPNFGIALGKAASIMSDLLLSGLFDECPKLRVGLIETWVGWIPRALEALDDIWLKNRDWRRIGLQHPPSHYWHRNMIGSFLDDRAGVAARQVIGVDKMMWSTDFPHFGTFWPRSRDVALASLAGVPDDERAAILSGNCIDFYGLQGRIGVAAR